MAPSNDLWYVGVLLEILSTMSGTIGKQLIRLSELKKRSNPKKAKAAFYMGLVVNTLCGPIIDMAAYSFASQSLIAPFGGLDVVWNAMLAPYLLRETLSFKRAAGCALILLGTTFCGAFGNHADKEYSIEYLEETFVNFRVLAYFICFFLWFLLNRFITLSAPRESAIRGVSLGCTAGTIAGNMFCVKAAIELIQLSIHDQDGTIWLHWMPYVMLLGAVFFATSNVVFMTQGLAQYEALFMVTIYEGSMIVSNCISGSIVLLDMKGMEAWRIALYFTGVAVIMFGMYVIFSEESKSQSSLMAGKASIEIDEPSCPESPRVGTPKGTRPSLTLEAITSRSPHAKNDLARDIPRSKSVDDISNCTPKSAGSEGLPKKAVSAPSVTSQCLKPEAEESAERTRSGSETICSI